MFEVNIVYKFKKERKIETFKRQDKEKTQSITQLTAHLFQTHTFNLNQNIRKLLSKSKLKDIQQN